MPSASDFNVPFEALFDRSMWLRRVVAKLPIANYPARFVNTARAFQNSSTGVRLFSIGSRLAARSDGLGRAFNYTTGDPDMNIWAEELNGPGMSDISPCASDGTYVFTFDISAGTCRYTGDLGSTWNTLFGGANNVTAAAYVRGLWFAATSDDEILHTVGPATPWTVVSLATLCPNYAADTAIPFELISNGVDTSLVLATGTDYIPREVGLSLSEAQLPGGNIAGGDWNALLGTFAVVNTSGQVYLSADGAAWTAGPNLGGSVTARSRVAALGRHWACICDGALAVFDTTTGTRVPFRLGGNDGSVGFTELHRHGDRVVAAYIDGAGDLTYSFSMRAVT